MNSVYFPVQIVVLFRRLVHVISTLSISNHYLLATQSNRVEDPKHNKQGTFSWTKLNWPWWWTFSAWRSGFTVFGGGAAIVTVLGQRPVAAVAHNNVQEDRNGTTSPFKVVSDITFPWFGQSWSWTTRSSVHAKRTLLEDAESPLQGSNRPREPFSSKNTIPSPNPKLKPECSDTIHTLLQNPALYSPIRTPRYPIVLCHGLYGFDVRGPALFPSLRLHYWSNILSILREKVGAEVIVTSVPGTGSIASRSETLHRQLQDKAKGREVNFLAHSMGGLDCRHLISRVKPKQYTPLSLTTISTPHRGSLFMDWCVNNIGIGKLGDKETVSATTPNTTVWPASPPPPPHAECSPPPSPEKPVAPFSLSLASLPSSFTSLLRSIVDSPAYANLTTSYLTHVFNPLTPDDPRVRYFSVAGRMAGVSVWHPLWLPKTVLDGDESRLRQRLREDWERDRVQVSDGTGTREMNEGDGVATVTKEREDRPLWAREEEWGNDGLVTVQSARWGEFLGTLEGCDHWAMRGARGIDLNVDLKPVSGNGGGNGGDGRGLGDWGRMVRAWKRDERHAEVVAAADGGGRGSMGDRTMGRGQERADDAIMKSSTDKLSAVLDWLVEQVPLSGRGKEENGGREAREVKRKDLDTKMDLERFYVALSRKLYDEGL